jgi:hypothetical protein
MNSFPFEIEKNFIQKRPPKIRSLKSFSQASRHHIRKHITSLSFSLSLSQMEKHSTMASSSSPTTFVQADTHTFRDLVQRLTGSSVDSEKLPVNPPSKLSPKTFTPGEPTGPRRSPFKLHERRHTHTMRKLEIKLGLTTLRNNSPRQTQRVDSPVQSPLTPLRSEPMFLPSSRAELPSSRALSDEEKAVAEKGFYFHPSPVSTPRGTEPPELLTLFPLSSPSQKIRDS